MGLHVEFGLFQMFCSNCAFDIGSECLHFCPQCGKNLNMPVSQSLIQRNGGDGVTPTQNAERKPCSFEAFLAIKKRKEAERSSHFNPKLKCRKNAVKDVKVWNG